MILPTKTYITDQEPRYCRKCGELTFNFYPSRIARCDWICNACSKKQKNEREKKQRESRNLNKY